MAKRNQYRLQIVLDQKEEAKNEAAKYLAEMRRKLKEEQEKEEELHEEKKANRQKRDDVYEQITHNSFTVGLDVSEAQKSFDFIKYLDAELVRIEEEIEQQRRKVELAEKNVEEALQDLIQASRELQVMQKHKENWTKKIKKEALIKEQNEMNEIGNVMYSNEKHI